MASCPECRLILIANAQRCSCGWEKENRPTRNHPPNVLDTLSDEITRIGLHKFRELPANTSLELSRYWIGCNAPADERFEQPREIATVAKDGARWICPYHLRLIGTLRAYALMDKHDRHIIIFGIKEEHVWWRGEPARDYISIIDETKLMRRVGIETYRKEAIAKLKHFLSGHVLHDPEADAERAAIQEEGIYPS